MKKLLLFASLFSPLIVAGDYVVPDLDIDETDPNCSNVNELLATATSDSARLSNYVKITLPARISKLNDAYASVVKTCDIIQSRRPSLMQISSSLTKKRMFEIQNLKNLQQDIKVLAGVAIGNKCGESGAPCVTLSQIKAKLYALSTAENPSDLCDDVKKSIRELADYLKWLGPAVQDTYIDGKLADRIDLLSSFNQDCNGCNSDDANGGDGGDNGTDGGNGGGNGTDGGDGGDNGGDGGDNGTDGGDGGDGGDNGTDGGDNGNNGGAVDSGCKWLFDDGQKVTFKCLGSIIVPEHTYLDSLTYTGGVQLAPSTTGGYTGTHFKVQQNEGDCSYSFQSLGSYFNANYQWVDGRTGDGSVGLAPITTGGYSGTHWAIEPLADGSYALKCLGSDYNANHLYMDGRTVDGSVGLAPVTTGGYSGTHWAISKE